MKKEWAVHQLSNMVSTKPFVLHSNPKILTLFATRCASAGQEAVFQGARRVCRSRPKGAALVLHHTFLRSGHNSDAALSSRPPSPCATLVGAGARGPVYDKERAERLSAAAVQVATDFAAGFK